MVFASRSSLSGWIWLRSQPKLFTFPVSWLHINDFGSFYIWKPHKMAGCSLMTACSATLLFTYLDFVLIIISYLDFLVLRRCIWMLSILVLMILILILRLFIPVRVGSQKWWLYTWLFTPVYVKCAYFASVWLLAIECFPLWWCKFSVLVLFLPRSGFLLKSKKGL